MIETELEKKIEALVENDYQQLGIKEIVSHARNDIHNYYSEWDRTLIEMRYEDLYGR